jgi:hypothetical protein
MRRRPPALNIFLNLLERGKIDAARRMPDGSLLTFRTGVCSTRRTM